MILDALRKDLDIKLAQWAKHEGIDSLPAYVLEEPPAGISADVACNLPLLLAKPLRKGPRFIADQLQKWLDGTLPMVEEVSVAGAGFINFRWKLPTLSQEIQVLLNEGSKYGRSSQATTKILVEFVSANPTGPLHVGHGRGAALGDSLALILSHLGHPVTREYYINDAGNQVRMLGESILARAGEIEGRSVVFPENGYHGDYIKDLAQDFLLNTPDRSLEGAIAFGVDKMRKKIEEDLAAFGVRFDSWFSEASLVKKGLVEKHVQALSKRNHVKDEDSALWFISPGEEDDKNKDKDRVLKKRDGQWTYFATDIAYHADKFERHFDRLVDIWGADHHGYVPRVKGAMQALGYDATKLHVILNQLVALTRNGTPVVMSKRSGEFVTLRDVLDEVGKDACRFFFAMRGPNTALDFDLELAKKHSVDNPVYYLQYAHARICAIFRQAEQTYGGATTQQSSQTSGPLLGSSAVGEFRRMADLSLLKEKEERALMRRLSLFPHSLRVCSEEDSPHPLANYLLSLARQFHFFYDHHRVLGDDAALTQARLALLDAVRTILKQGLALLGVSAPESM